MIAMAMPPASASLSEKFDYWLSRLRGVEHRGGGQYVACCPHHGDEKQSLSTRIGDRSIVATCFTGCKFPQICHAVGVTANWAFDPKESAPVMRDVASWLYCDELGDPVFRTVRREDGTVGKDGKKSKEFRQQSPDGKGGWKNGVKGVRVIPYRLPNIVFSEGVVLIVEGEKHCDRLDELGFVATCNAGGAATGNGKGKWKSEHSEFLRGRDVVILPDNDEPGRSHAHNVAKSLIEHGAKSVRVAILPGLPEKGDIVDFLNAGGTKDQIQQAIDESKPVEEAFPEEQQSSAVEGEDGPTPMEIAESFLKIKYDHPERSTLAYHRKSFFEYTGTHYRPVEDEDLRCYLTSHIDMVTRSMSMNRLASVMQCVKAQTHVPSSAEASSWIDDIERPGQFIA
ncbi:MAG TPA: hypothetical protein VNQ76_21205, partial [Planctomicrobium sp.]|nr:hypothetical protein [Planctomicrobium sp.]